MGFSIYDRYLFKALLRAFLLVLLVLALLLLFTGLLDEFKTIGRNHYDLMSALLYVLAQLPAKLYQMAALIFLMSALLALAGLAGRSELIVMQTSGLSPWRLFIKLAKGLLVLYAIFAFSGEVWAPQWMQAAEQMRSQLLGQSIQKTSANRFWLKTEQGLLRIGAYLPDGRLQEVSLYQVDGQNRFVGSIHAQTALVESGKQGVWTLHAVTRFTNLGQLPARPLMKKEYFDVLPHQVLVAPEILQGVLSKEGQMPFSQLHAHVRFMEEAGLYAGRYGVDLYRKFTQPVLILALAFMLLPLVLGSQRQVSMSQQVFIGVMIGIGVILFQQFVDNAVLLNKWNYWIAVLAVPLTVVALGSYLTLRKRN
jgi:lipopolysaccharide export system permease protein